MTRSGIFHSMGKRKKKKHAPIPSARTTAATDSTLAQMVRRAVCVATAAIALASAAKCATAGKV